MKDAIKGFSTVLAVLLALLTLGWVLGANSWAMFKAFAPLNEQVRRETFEESKAYRDGAVQELQNMQFEYIKADPAHKSALASIIRHRAAGLPVGVLPPSLYQFIKELP